MKMTITAKNMVITPAITERVTKKTDKMSRYLRPDTEMFVRMRKEKNGRRIVEITVPMDGITLRAEASGDDNLFVSIDRALDKLEKQIQRARTKLDKRLREDAFKTDTLEYSEDTEEDLQPAREIVRHKTFPVRPMSVEDAVMQMELLGHDFFCFVDIDTERTNVLYLRKDGNLGLLEPEA